LVALIYREVIDLFKRSAKSSTNHSKHPHIL